MHRCSTLLFQHITKVWQTSSCPRLQNAGSLRPTLIYAGTSTRPSRSLGRDCRFKSQPSRLSLDFRGGGHTRFQCSILSYIFQAGQRQASTTVAISFCRGKTSTAQTNFRMNCSTIGRSFHRTILTSTCPFQGGQTRSQFAYTGMKEGAG